MRLFRAFGVWRCRRGHHRYRAVIKFVYHEFHRFHWRGGYERWSGLECQRCGHRTVGVSKGDPIPAPAFRREDDPVYQEARRWAGA